MKPGRLQRVSPVVLVFTLGTLMPAGVAFGVVVGWHLRELFGL